MSADLNPSLSEYSPSTSPHPAKQLKPLRIWIPILLLPFMAIARFVPGFVENGPSMIWMVSAFGPFLIGFAMLLWWLIASRANWKERLLGVIGVIGLIAVLILVQVLADPTMVGPLTTVMTIPLMMLGFTLALIVLGSRLSMSRTGWALLVALLFASVSLFFKTDGVWGNFAFGLDWRWKESSEEKLLAARKNAAPEPKAELIPASELSKREWPNFRGLKQDGAQHGCVFSDDWKSSPPKELWRIPVGPSWSSFIASGHYLFTQEQRGEVEMVVCYDSSNGKQVWEQANESRFFESLGGLGPRATPTLYDGYIYALGAEGWLLKIRATNGDLIWKKNIQELAARSAPPMWGFSSSPLVHEGLVIVHAGGKDDKGIVALDAESGDLRWTAPAGEQSYSSVQAATILGKKYLLLISDEGAHFYDPSTGKVKLDYSFPHMGYRALQPQILGDDQVLIPAGMGTGTRLVKLAMSGEELTASEVWTSKDMKPDFNDFMVHQGYLYGFDNTIFSCIDLQTGKRKWRGGRYEKGQALLLADSDLIIVVSEKGDLVLLRATPDKMDELAKIPAMTGKTWNHPIVVDNRLYLRNSEEAICYELPTKSSK